MPFPTTASHQRTNPWKTIDYSSNSSVGELEGEECGIEKRNGSPWYNKSKYKCLEQSKQLMRTERMTGHSDLTGPVLCQGSLDGRQDTGGRPNGEADRRCQSTYSSLSTSIHPNLDCVAAKPLWTRMGKPAPGKEWGSNSVSGRSRSVRVGMLRRRMGQLMSAPTVRSKAAHIFVVSVP